MSHTQKHDKQYFLDQIVPRTNVSRIKKMLTRPACQCFFSEAADEAIIVTNHTIFMGSCVSRFDYSWDHVSVFSVFLNRKNKNADMWAPMSFFL
jgi:hypothetical protein